MGVHLFAESFPLISHIANLHSDLNRAHCNAAHKPRQRGCALHVRLSLDAVLHLYVLGLADIAGGIAHLLSTLNKKRHQRVDVKHDRLRCVRICDCGRPARRKILTENLQLR